MANRVDVVGEAAPDWITLTFRDQVAWEKVGGVVMGAEAGAERSVMQYKGPKGLQWFVGEGEQGGTWHGMVQATGGRAALVFPGVLAACRALVQWETGVPYGSDQRAAPGRKKPRPPLVRCTRLDLQVTVPKFDAKLQAVCRLMRRPSTKWRRKGRKPTIDLIDKQDGYSTLYVGSYKTKNGVLLRVYVKPIQGKDYIRFEAMYRGARARAAWAQLLNAPKSAPYTMLRGEFDVLPEAVARAWAPIGAALAGAGNRVLIESPEVDPWERYQWWKQSVFGAVGTLVGHEVDELLEEDLLRLLQEIRRAGSRRGRKESLALPRGRTVGEGGGNDPVHPPKVA